jgi:hypothetical protein
MSVELGQADTAVNREGRSDAARFYLRDRLAWLLQFVKFSVASSPPTAHTLGLFARDLSSLGD